VHHLPSVVRTRVIAAREGRARLEHVGWLDPYTAETITAEARRAGPGARLEITIPKRAASDREAAVESLFGWLRERGVEVVIRRDDDVE
jgi:hypothetical protein